jgi:hypothetical protein
MLLPSSSLFASLPVLDSLLVMFVLFVPLDILLDVCKSNSDEYSLHQIYIQFPDASKDISLHMCMLENINTALLDAQMDRTHRFYNLENACILFIFFDLADFHQVNLHLKMKMLKHSFLWFMLKFVLGRLSFLEAIFLQLLVRY